ncbi:MAG: hypothetical protein JO337_09820 [Acidimicrobiales bacterium]|nr:hypothetical protein [Acidimicrobiales bacterium]
MLKRIRWLGAGLAVGVGGSIWAQRKMKSVASRYRPAGVAQGAATRAVDAWREGRSAMKEREAELRGDPSSGRRTHRP